VVQHVVSAHELRLARRRANYVATGVRINVDLEMDPKLQQRLEQHPAIYDRMALLVREVADLADATCPRQTGELAASLQSTVMTTPRGPVGVVGYGHRRGTGFYAHMVHNGTAHSLAQPWLLNALLAVVRGGSLAQGQARRAVA
jgi:hypothetical protein